MVEEASSDVFEPIGVAFVLPGDRIHEHLLGPLGHRPGAPVTDGAVIDLANRCHLGGCATEEQFVCVVQVGPGNVGLDGLVAVFPEERDHGFPGDSVEDAGSHRRRPNDAVADEQKGLIYKMRVLMARSEIEVNGSFVALVPGMTVSVESKTGTRKLIEFFLNPLLRYRNESARER